ncbi:group III truncated hemoglobin [Roseovarius sp. S4756]|uniref:group III truncated hemoglobin n=1 Tax=Roseovarius maritimus TaxID=3342637 RepID=UPI00372BD81C
MCDPLKIGQARPGRTRAQRRAAAEIMGIDDVYLSRMIHFFVARVRADKRLQRFYAVEDPHHRAQQVARMTAFWRNVAFDTGDYADDLFEKHRHLPDVHREDFERWLELFRATLEETAPTTEAARYLMVRTERVARNLELAMFGEPSDAAQKSSRHQCRSGQS